MICLECLETALFDAVANSRLLQFRSGFAITVKVVFSSISLRFLGLFVVQSPAALYSA